MTDNKTQSEQVCPAILFDCVEKKYYVNKLLGTAEITAFKNLSFTINKGDSVVLLGLNGAGKSTFFLHFNGIIVDFF